MLPLAPDQYNATLCHCPVAICTLDQCQFIWELLDKQYPYLNLLIQISSSGDHKKRWLDGSKAKSAATTLTDREHRNSSADSGVDTGSKPGSDETVKDISKTN